MREGIQRVYELCDRQISHAILCVAFPERINQYRTPTKVNYGRFNRKNGIEQIPQISYNTLYYLVTKFYFMNILSIIFVHVLRRNLPGL